MASHLQCHVSVMKCLHSRVFYVGDYTVSGTLGVLYLPVFKTSPIKHDGMSSMAEAQHGIEGGGGGGGGGG